MTLEIWAAMLSLAILAPAVWLYNRLVAERNLVPQLVEAVRGYAAHEKALLTSVAELRAAALAAPKAAERFTHERALGERLASLVLLQENYPQLKADANFRDLSAKLVEIEDALQYARRFYNGAVKQYLTRIESFPDNVMATLFRFQPVPFFETADREPVKVAL
ncbi:MAG TPA: LemA family protein [Burkholderiales bacterium]|nr:LemA family protein [Burkholderiales bacterium]